MALWPKTDTHTHASNDSYEHPPRSEFELVVSSDVNTKFLITPLQCIDCHPLLGGVVELDQLPDATVLPLLLYMSLLLGVPKLQLL